LTDLVPVVVSTESAQATRELGGRLASVLRAGDVVILAGELGAGKTTLTQGLGAALGVRGDVTSPTFVISRVHQPASGDTGLVHVDAYRLGAEAELDDLDLDAYTEDAVTVVEWGDGIAEGLSPDRLHVHVSRGEGAGDGDADLDAEQRTVTVTPVGRRWVGAELRTALELDGR